MCAKTMKPALNTRAGFVGQVLKQGLVGER